MKKEYYYIESNTFDGKCVAFVSYCNKRVFIKCYVTSHLKNHVYQKPFFESIDFDGNKTVQEYICTFLQIPYCELFVEIDKETYLELTRDIRYEN